MSRKAEGARKKPANRGRHESGCKVCRHPKRQEIERDFITWQSPIVIAREYGLRNRASIYRHAHAFGLFEKRKRNVRAALERIIEQAGDVEATASAVVAAVQAYSKINAQGQWVDRSEHVNLNELFERMSKEELEHYAREGVLPGWFTQEAGATPLHSQEGANDVDT
jgi:hypothetical protein